MEHILECRIVVVQVRNRGRVREERQRVQELHVGLDCRLVEVMGLGLLTCGEGEDVVGVHTLSGVVQICHEHLVGKEEERRRNTNGRKRSKRRRSKRRDRTHGWLWRWSEVQDSNLSHMCGWDQDDYENCAWRSMDVFSGGAHRAESRKAYLLSFASVSCCVAHLYIIPLFWLFTFVPNSQCCHAVNSSSNFHLYPFFTCLATYSRGIWGVYPLCVWCVVFLSLVPVVCVVCCCVVFLVLSCCCCLFVLETIRTGAMHIIHIFVKSEETQRLRIEFCTVLSQSVHSTWKSNKLTFVGKQTVKCSMANLQASQQSLLRHSSAHVEHKRPFSQKYRVHPVTTEPKQPNQIRSPFWPPMERQHNTGSAMGCAWSPR